MNTTIVRGTLIAMVSAMVACGDSSEPSTDAGVSNIDQGAVLVDVGPQPDAGAPTSLRAVPGVLTFSATRNEETHLYSVNADGSQRQRLTSEAGPWSYHAVGPVARYIAAVRHESTTAEGRPDLTTAGEVWIIDVQQSRKYAVSPAGCDAGIGGVSWLNDAMLVFAMSCADGTSGVYIADYTDESRDIARMLSITEHPFPVRDANAALNTSIVAYVVDAERCIEGSCVTKPQVWIADTETDSKCQVTDANREYIDGNGAPGNPPRVGDHSPAFTDQLRGLTFSRNVPMKTAGPEGHHDLFRVGLNLSSFFDGDIRCEQPGTEANLTDTLIGDGYPENQFEHDRYPQAAVGERAPDGAILFVGRRHTDPIASTAYVSDISGAKTAVSQPTEWVVYARWIVSDLMLTGSRD